MSGSTILATPTFRLQPKQREFAKSKADIVVYGGAAGGGKSFALLYEPIGRELHRVPGFTGVIFRRESTQITNPGALWDQSAELYPSAGGKGIRGLLEYRFKAPSRIAFRHIEHEDDKQKYQGTEICYLAFDELTHFTESQFWYLISRNRSKCGVRPYVRCSCNPDPGWVKRFLAPWVDNEFDGPRAKSGEVRWFVRIDGQIKWVPEGTKRAKSLTFIKSSIYDNQILLEANPEYLATLESLLPVERARLLDGDWDVRREGLVYSGFESCIIETSNQVDVPPARGGMDFGFNNAFAAVWGHLDHDDVLWITGMRYVRQCTLPIHSEAIPKGVEWWCDPAGASDIRELRVAGHDTRPCVHKQVMGLGGAIRKPLLSGIDKVTERIRTGRLKIIRQACLPLVAELSTYHYDPEKRSEDPVKEDDHAADALRYLVVGLDRGRAVPSIPSADLGRDREADFAREQEAEKAAKREAERVMRANPDPDDPNIWGTG